MKPRVVTTWDDDPRTVPELAELEIEWVVNPLTRTAPRANIDLRNRLEQDPPGWLLLFSRAGIDGLLLTLDSDVDILKRWSVAAVGPATTQLLESSGVPVSFAGPGSAAGLCASLQQEGVNGPVLALTGDLEMPASIRALSNSGLSWARYEVYAQHKASDRESLSLSLGGAAAVCLSSPGAVDRLVELVGGGGLPPILTIGPTTAARLADLGLKPDFVGPGTGFAGFLEGLERFT